MKTLLPYPEAAVIWKQTVPARSGYDEARAAPFNKAINVFSDGVSR